MLRSIFVIALLSLANRCSQSKSHTNKTNTTLTPYHASIMKDGRQHCSGSLISQNFIITAARCFWGDLEISRYSVLLGLLDFQINGILYGINKIKIHDEFSNQSHLHDIALIRLGKKVTTSGSIKNIRLDNKNTKRGTWALASGWRKGHHDFVTKNMVTVSRKSCFSKQSSKKDLSVEIICTRGKCLEDYGSPLVNKKRLIGILSYCTKGKFSAYTNVAAHISWILDSIQNTYSK